MSERPGREPVPTDQSLGSSPFPAVSVGTSGMACPAVEKSQPFRCQQRPNGDSELRSPSSSDKAVPLLSLQKWCKKSLFKPSQTEDTGFPWWTRGWGFACQSRGHRFNPWSRKTPHATKQLSPWTTATELTCHNYWSLHARSLCSATQETIAVRRQHTARKRSTTRTRAQQWRPIAAKNE